ncbi:MAG: SAM-dependent methyltransferase [Ferrimonas sp.]
MSANSRSVSSNQQGVHPQLARTVQRHLNTAFQAPYAEHSLRLFERLSDWRNCHPQRPLILDSCCGIGESTQQLAARYPNALVLGLDKSAQRIAKHSAMADSAALYRVERANLNDLWRLMVAANWQVARHYVLYPNPWPKAVHLQRRWHGGPLFPSLLALGGQLQLRSNWPIYLQECQQALALAGYRSQLSVIANSTPALTPFERKYRLSGHVLFKLKSDLTHPVLP